MNITDLGDNKYRIIVSGGYKENGERNRKSKTITAKNYREASKVGTAMQAKIDEYKHGVIDDNITFSKASEKYKLLSMSNLSEKTKERYLGLIDNHFLVFFGKKFLGDISTIDIDVYLQSLNGDGVRRDGKPGGISQKTKRHHYTTLHKMFEQFKAWKLISENPCSLANKPKLIKTEAKFLDIEQTKELLSALSKAPIKYRTIIFIAIFTGARRSEILGLQWGDIEIDKGIMTIRRVNQYTAQKGIYTTECTKNGTPARTVVMPQGLSEILKTYKNSGMCLKGEGDWLFTKDTKIEEPMHPDLPTKWFSNFIKANNLTKITFHQLRHTSVTIMIYQGTDIQTIANQRGHSATVMLNTYAHVMNRAKTEAADKLQKEFFE